MREIQELYIHNDIDKNATNQEKKNRDNFVSSVLNDGNQENNDDIDAAQASSVGISAVRKRLNVLSKEDYCKLLRSTNTVSYTHLDVYKRQVYTLQDSRRNTDIRQKLYAISIL